MMVAFPRKIRSASESLSRKKESFLPSAMVTITVPVALSG